MFKSGFIAIIGRPNVGKSTLINSIVGQKVAITSHKPQTTRTRVLGIKNIEHAQLVFIDTPGIHRAKDPLHRSMVKTALDALSGADLVLFMIEAAPGFTAGDKEVLDRIADAQAPVFAVINKIDEVKKEALLPLIEKLSTVFPFREIVPVSALKQFNLDELVNALARYLPEGPKLFPDDIFTDQTERFLAAEIIREKITALTHRELPYAVAVSIDAFNEGADLIRIAASILVDKESQKGILIGKKGSMLKEIGTRARHDMENFFGTHVFLELQVKQKKNWQRNASLLSDLGYSPPK